MINSPTPSEADLKLAAKNMDWQQVVQNGGPPCFHLDEYLRTFCGRAEWWQGHGHDSMHPYISLEDLLSCHMQPERDELERLREQIVVTLISKTQIIDERDAAKKEVERLKNELETADDLYARLSAKEQAEFRTIEQQKSELTAFRNAMEKAKEAIVELMGVAGRMHGEFGCTDDGCAYNKSYSKGLEALAAIEALLRDPPQ